MKESLRRALGRKVISRSSAQDLGTITQVLVDGERHRIVVLILGKGKKAQLVDWEQLSGFGQDAVIVADESSLREPANERERAAADGKLGLIGKRALTDAGNEVGEIADVFFDPRTGHLEGLLVGDREIPAGSLLGNGSYAAVVQAAPASP